MGKILRFGEEGDIEEGYYRKVVLPIDGQDIVFEATGTSDIEVKRE